MRNSPIKNGVPYIAPQMLARIMRDARAIRDARNDSRGERLNRRIPVLDRDFDQWSITL